MSDNLLPLRSQRVSVGKHLVLDAWDVASERLNDPQVLREALKKAVDACGATLINLCVHQFSPYGVTGTATLAESHIAVHTWPEHGYLGADLFFCGAGDPRPAMDSLAESYQAGEVRIRELDRGIGVVAESAAEPPDRAEVR